MGDLHDMLASLGKDPTDDYLEGMMNEAPGAINFTMFLTLFGERLQGTDPEDVIKNASAVSMMTTTDSFMKTDFVSFSQQWVTGLLMKTLTKCIGKLLSKMECLITLSSQEF